MKKRPLCLILTLALLFGCVPAARAAVGDILEDGYVETMPLEEAIDDEPDGLSVGQVSPGRYLSTLDGEHYEEEDGIPLPDPIAGDMNNDGNYSLKDVSMLYNAVIDSAATAAAKAQADFNGDGSAGLQDVYLLFQQVALRSNGIKIYISPSNQNANTYSYGGTNEAVQCNYIGFAVQKALMRCGFDTMLADYCDNMDLRAQYSNDWCADLHLPLHTNAHWPNGTYSTGGTQIYYNPDDGDAVSIAASVFAQLGPLTPGCSSLEGLRSNTTWKEVRLTNAPTVYCEMEYHDVVDYAKWITEHHSDLAEAIVKGICAYYQVTYFAP